MTIIYKHTCNSVNKYNCLTAKPIAYNMLSMNLGERIAAAREHAKLNQRELAEKLNGLMTQQNISLLERGITKGTEYIVQIAMVCGVRPEWLAVEHGDMVGSMNIDENSPEAKVLLAMKHMDPTTKYQVVKISNSLTESETELNGSK